MRSPAGSEFAVAQSGRPEDAPAVLPGMHVIGELGRGAQSVVYRVRRDGSDFAAKVLLSRAGSPDATASALFRREAALLAWVNHRGLAAVHEVGEAAGRPYLVMDLIEGSDLAILVNQGPLSPERVIDLGVQIGDALAAVHRVGLIHRDVKPANVIVQPDGRARLIDLGLAGRHADGPGGRSAGAGADPVVGTLAYASPEQSGALNRPVDARSDLYSLGVVLYECVTGQPPYLADDVGELLRLHATAPIPDPRSLRQDVPAGLAAILTRLLAKDPDDRYHTAAGLVADLSVLAAEPAADFPLGQHDRPAEEHDLAPLLGRDDEYAELVAVWERTRLGHGGTVAIRGGTGAGKTRLAYDLARQVRDEGRPVLSASCAPDAEPLAPLRAAVDAYVNAVADLPGPARIPAQQRLRDAAGAAATLVGRLSPALATLLDATAAAPDAGHEAFVNAAADFLADLARAHDGALLSFDNAHHLDEATRSVLRQLTLRLDDTPLLLLTAAPDSAEDSADLIVALEPLATPVVAALVAALTRGMAASAVLVERLVARGAATPLEVQEYLAAVVDAGLLTPDWGTWSVDLAGLETLALPGDVVGLILRRLDGLTPEARDLLSAAAVAGMCFAADLPGAVLDVTAGAAAGLLDGARSAGVLEVRGDAFVFTHESLRSALLDGLTPGRRREVHQRIAETLTSRSHASGDALLTDPAQLYPLARHHLQGELDRDPAWVMIVCTAAGRLALADNAPADAVGFLEPAVALADRYAAGIDTGPSGSEIREVLGTAYHAAGRFADAVRAFELSLEATTGGPDRARILAQIAEVYGTQWNIQPGLDAVRLGLSELGRAMPANPLLLVLTSIGRFLAGLLVAGTGLGFGTARGDKAACYELEARLYDGLAVTGIQGMRPLLNAVATLRMLYPAARLGPSKQYVNALAFTNVLLVIMGFRNYRGALARARAIAGQLGDPRLASHVTWVGHLMPSFAGRSHQNSEMLRFAQHDRNLPLTEYIISLVTQCADLLNRGHVHQARDLYETGRARLAAADLADHAYSLIGIVSDAARGWVAETDVQLQRAAKDPVFGAGTLRVSLLSTAAQVAVEQRDLGETFDRAAADFAALNLAPGLLLMHQRPVYVALAYGRIEQAMIALADRSAAPLAAARSAVAQLGKVTTTPDMVAHHLVAVAYLRHLAGDHDGALDALAVGDRMLREADTPSAEYEAARLRARALTALSLNPGAITQVRAARSLADTHGWPHRADWLRAEFPEAFTDRPDGASRAMHSSVMRSQTRVGAGHTELTGGYSPYAQRLAALEQISLAASRVLDPTELTRIALDEAIRILGAERAYLFLTDTKGVDSEQPDRLLPHLGRDADGADIDVLTGYGSTLIEGVRLSREPLVVTGTDEGAALGSQSAVMHGLRSIMVAPLLLDARLLGVIYLDSRIAKGMFTSSDVGILTAITNHVAAALETARAAQLAVAVHAAEQQRDVADTIRQALTEVTATLDPAEVLARLAATLSRSLTGDDARLIQRNGDKLILTDLADPTMQVNLATDAHPDLDALMLSPRPVRSGPGVELAPIFTDPITGCGLRSPESWLAIPLHSRAESVGLVLVSSAHPAGYTETEIDIADALTGQGMIAYDNARLFAQVKLLATTDELTGIFNRRQFFLLAHRELAVARRRDLRLAAAMIDIDHFKKVNDTHGHHTGDQVIQTVARRLTETIRGTDILGRYGGEEFALILPDVGDSALATAERLRTAIATSPVDTDAGPLPITISVGVAYLSEADGGGDAEILLANADKALYSAKKSGRNRVILHRDETAEGPAA